MPFAGPTCRSPSCLATVCGSATSTRFAAYLLSHLGADLELTPPRGASPRHFVLVNDSVTHEVRNHVVWVIDSRSNRLLGALQYPGSRLLVDRPAD